MDYVDGTDAASLLKDRYPAGMPVDEVAAIVKAIADALDYAHNMTCCTATSSPPIFCSPTPRTVSNESC